LKIDTICYEELIHPDLSNCIEDITDNQVLILSAIEIIDQKEKKGISYIENIKHNVAILKVELRCK
jgi:ABC-type Zn uptake system ZnuABC Zn-binding protein ZnuA